MLMEGDHRGKQLPSELWEEIANRTGSYGDYICVRAACKQWSADLPKIPKHIKNIWLALPFKDGFKNQTCRPFYNVDEKKVDHLESPADTRNTLTRGSGYGWLILVGLDGKIQLWNPFTRSQIDLPHLSTFADITDFQPNRRGEEYSLVDLPEDEDEPDHYTYDKLHMQKSYVEKIVISSPPDDENQDFMAVAIYGEFNRMAFCRRGDKKWSDVPSTNSRPIYRDVTIFAGKIYAIDEDGQLSEFDMTERSTSPEGGIVEAVAPIYKDSRNADKIGLADAYHEYRYRYVVGTSFGLLVVIRRITDYKKYTVRDGKKASRLYYTSGFKVYKLEKSSGKGAVWTKLNDLKNHVLVIGQNSSVCMLYPQSDNGNRIYYTDNYLESQYAGVVGGHDIGVFDMSTKTTTKLFPKSKFIWPAPVSLIYP